MPRLRIILATLLIGALSAFGASAKILHYGNAVEPQELDPQVVTGTPESHIILALFEGLVLEDASGKIGPGAAERSDISPDRLIYTFHLRADARWSDGKPVTASDFVRSFRRMLTPSLAAEDAYFFYHIAGAEDYHRGKLTDFARTGILAVDAHTLRLTLRQPTPFFLRLLASAQFCPVPLHVIEKLGPADRRGNPWTRPEHFVGNGPFTLKSWRTGQKIVAVRSPTYWNRAHVKLDEIHFYPVDNPDAEERMFRTGQLHITAYLPVSKIAPYRRADPSPLHIDPYAGTYYYVFNTSRPPFNDVRVRRALSFAIDRETLVKRVFQAGEQTAYQFVPPGLEGYESRPLFQADVTEARRLLAEAGFPGGKGFPSVELVYNTSENHRVIAEAIQQMWRKALGVEVTLANQEWKVYLDNMKSHHFQLMRAAWISDIPHQFLDRWETGNPNNDAVWSNPAYDRLLHAALEAPTDAARADIYLQMEKILIAEMPFAPIAFYTKPRLISPKVLNFRTLPDDSFPWQDIDLAP